MSGNYMLGGDREEQIGDETVREFFPSFFFIIVPLLFAFLGGLILFWSLVRLPIYYNYLRGMPSPIDQSALALLGSDLSRLVLLVSAIIGIIVGSFLSRLVTKKLDTVRREGEALLSVRMYIGLIVWWQCAWIPYSTISLLEMALFGYPTSHFLSDISWYLMAGYFIAAGIPVMLKYFQLRWHADSIGSQVKLVESRVGKGFIKPIQKITMKLIPSGPDP
ncbi:MAG: hypothetical protein KAQ65_07915 [Candidatus Thorarchaeota archaeon]|nr:hypothetical protein [Candidatus Thorarchaeota archaeon]MCK5239590.1 hypothetical protein [Candidatus Thorarchaeota archaeon]